MSELEREFATRIALPEVQYQVGKRMEQIVGYFKPGVKIAVMVRSRAAAGQDGVAKDSAT